MSLEDYSDGEIFEEYDRRVRDSQKDTWRETEVNLVQAIAMEMQLAEIRKLPES